MYTIKRICRTLLRCYVFYEHYDVEKSIKFALIWLTSDVYSYLQSPLIDAVDVYVVCLLLGFGL